MSSSSLPQTFSEEDWYHAEALRANFIGLQHAIGVFSARACKAEQNVKLAEKSLHNAKVELIQAKSSMVAVNVDLCMCDSIHTAFIADGEPVGSKWYTIDEPDDGQLSLARSKTLP